MGAKAKHPTRARQSKRPLALTAEDVAAPSTKVHARAARVTSAKAGKKAAGKKHRLYPESVPPALVAEVFDVSGADEEELQPSLPPPAPSQHAGGPRLPSKPPSPPRPSLPPSDDDALELGEEELEPDDDAARLLAERSAPLLTPPPTMTDVRARRSGAGTWVAMGAAALGLGLVLGSRTRAEEPARAVRARAVEPHARVAPAAQLTELTAVGTASAVPDPMLDIDAVPHAELAPSPPTDSSVTPPSASAPEHAPVLPAAPVLREDLPPFDAEAAAAAISAQLARASSCRGPADAPGQVTATLRYAPSGRVTTATVSGPFAGTPVGGCIAATLRGARVPAFSGDYLTVKRTAFLR